MIRHLWCIALLCAPTFVSAQTASDLVAKNLEARGGMEKIKAIKTLRMTGKAQFGSFVAQVSRLAMAPNMVRDAFTIQGMSQIMAYDGSTGWRVSPFEGRKDPELMGDEELRDIIEEADFYGPLVDYSTKDNRIEYLGHDTVDGDDAYRLKVTLANGDIIYYFLDPDTYLEIRTEKMEFVRGGVHESVTNLGSYKKVDGVYFPFSLEQGSPNQDSNSFAKITFEKIEANVPLDAADFKMHPAASAATKAVEPAKENN
jgi:outer membrane lipoprotein-sorting protein